MVSAGLPFVFLLLLSARPIYELSVLYRHRATCVASMIFASHAFSLWRIFSFCALEIFIHFCFFLSFFFQSCFWLIRLDKIRKSCLRYSTYVQHTHTIYRYDCVYIHLQCWCQWHQKWSKTNPFCICQLNAFETGSILYFVTFVFGRARACVCVGGRCTQWIGVFFLWWKSKLFVVWLAVSCECVCEYWHIRQTQHACQPTVKYFREEKCLPTENRLEERFHNVPSMLCFVSFHFLRCFFPQIRFQFSYSLQLTGSTGTGQCTRVHVSLSILVSSPHGPILPFSFSAPPRSAGNFVGGALDSVRATSMHSNRCYDKPTHTRTIVHPIPRTLGTKRQVRDREREHFAPTRMCTETYKWRSRSNWIKISPCTGIRV